MSEIRLQKIWKLEDRIKKSIKDNIENIECIYFTKEFIFKMFNNDKAEDDLKGITMDEIMRTFDFLISSEYIYKYTEGQYNVTNKYKKYLSKIIH